MRRSEFNTYSMPVLGTDRPTFIGRSEDRPARLRVSVFGTDTTKSVFIALGENDLQAQGTTAALMSIINTFRLSVGDSMILYLTPLQALSAIADGTGVTLSVHITDAHLSGD